MLRAILALSLGLIVSFAHARAQTQTFELAESVAYLAPMPAIRLRPPHIRAAFLPGALQISVATGIEKAGPSLALFSSPWYSCVNNFYVSTTGSDTTGAGTQGSSWATIQRADTSSRVGGDCINVAPGTYEANVLLVHGGTAPTATGYVVYRCQTLDGCHVLAPGSGHLWGIKQPANFIVVDGFELDGNNALLTDGVADDCIASDGDTYGTGQSSHHIWVLNSITHHCGLGGIGLNNKEWYYAIHNTVYHNAWNSGFQGSGIGFVVVQCIESGNANCASGSTYAGGTGTYAPSGNDTAAFNSVAGIYTPFHNVVAWNNVYNNEIAPNNPVGCGAHTDGNGIIMDTWWDESTLELAFPYQSLLLGNVSYANGGRGIHIFAASNMTVANNTMYGNGTDNCLPALPLVDMSQDGGSNNVWVNNLVYTLQTTPNSTPFDGGGLNAAVYAGGGRTDVGDGGASNNNTYLNNITDASAGLTNTAVTSQDGNPVNGNGLSLFGSDATNYTCAANKCVTNALFVAPASNNFALQSASPAIGYVTAESFIPAVLSAAGGGCSSTLSSCP